MNTYDQLAQDRASAIRCLLSAGSPFHDAVSGSWFVSDYGTVRKVLARPDLMARDAENATAGLTESQREKVEPLERHFRRWLAFGTRLPGGARASGPALRGGDPPDRPVIARRLDGGGDGNASRGDAPGALELPLGTADRDQRPLHQAGDHDG
jgi:hypothetical protein